MLERENNIECLIRLGLLVFFLFWGLISVYHFANAGVVVGGVLLTVLRLVFFLHCRLPKDLAKMVLWSYWDVSYTVVPAFSLTFSLEDLNGEIDPNTVFLGQLIVIIAGSLMLIGSCLFGKHKKLPKRHQSARRLEIPRITSISFALFISASFMLTLIVDYMGIAEMGTRTGTFTKLPFKLEGLINVSRNLYIPIIFVFFVDLFSRMQLRKYYLVSILALCLWASFEMYVRFSKGFLFVVLMPLAFLFIYQRKLKLWMLATGGVGILAWIALYPYIGILRSATQSSMVTGEDFTYLFSSVNAQFVNSLDTIMRRIFSDAVYLQNVLSFHAYGQPSVGQIAEVVRFGGEATYYTRVVLGFNFLFFSAGMSGVPGGYLMYGYVGMAVCAVALSFLACWSDRLIYSRVYGSSFNCAVICYLVYALASTEFFAIFYRVRDFMEFFVALGMVLFVSKKMTQFDNPRDYLISAR